MVAKTSKSKSTKGAPPLAHLAEKPLTPRYENLAAYIEEQTGYVVSDPYALQLALSLYGKFQKSDINREYLSSLAEKREERLAAREERLAAREARKAEREAKAAAKAAAPAKKAVAKKAAGKSKGATVTELPKPGKPKRAAKKAVKVADSPF